MKRKKILCLMAIAIITVFIALACSDKPTNASNFSTMEFIERATGASGETPQPEFSLQDGERKLNINMAQGLSQFRNKSFKSGGYIRNKDHSKLFHYYADVRVDSQGKPYISVIRKYVYEDVLEDQGKLYTISNETGTNYNLEVVIYKVNSSTKTTAKATFTEDGRLIIKFSNYRDEIICSLTENLPEEIYRSSELAGDWNDESADNWKQFKIDYYGNIELFSGGIPGRHISYTGKIDGIFKYPYKAEITCVDNDGKKHNATITFKNETNAEASFEAYVDLSFRPTWWGWEEIHRSFTRDNLQE